MDEKKEGVGCLLAKTGLWLGLAIFCFIIAGLLIKGCMAIG